MSQSYKERCLLTDDATAMWSFDGDAFDAGSHLPLINSIIDEVDNQNPAQILHDTPNIPSMTIGRPSLVELESSNQFSGIFGIGTAQDIPGYWPKTYLSVNHSGTFSFTNRGSFSVEFLFKKNDEAVWGASYGNPTYWHKHSPVIRKNGVFTISTHWAYGGEYLVCTGPLATWNIQKTSCDYEARVVHVVLTWNVEKIAEFEYKATQSLYMNNRLMGGTSQNYFDNTYPNTNITTPIEIGGFSTVPSGHTTQGDRNASRLYIDQVSIYSRALSHNEVSAHYKKIFTYRNMVLNESPECFWDMADAETNANNDIVADVGSKNGELRGGYVRGTAGPDQLPTTSAVEFSPTGYLIFPTLDYYSSPTKFRSISGNYTFEFWFRSGCNDPCTLLSMKGYGTNFDGWWVELNKFGNSYSTGAIQFTERRGVQCKSLGTYNDNKWHHLAVRRSGQDITLFVDGIVAGTVSSGVSYLEDPGQLMVFGDSSTSYAGPGAMCYFAIYNYALSDSQIECRSTYNVGYEIKGVVTLMGNPVEATLRFYKSNTGVLIGEIDSDPITGEYRKELFNNSSVDIMVFDKYNKNVRYRAYGPVAPAGFEDYPIII